MPTSRVSSSATPLRGITIVVVGAGLAGLTAARTLSKRGADVHVVDARERVGGRVHTLRDGELGPFHAEAGGELVDEDHAAIRQLAAELGVPLVRVLRRGFGLALEVKGRVQIAPSQRAIWSELRRLLTPALQAFDAARRDWHSAIASELASRSVTELLSMAGAGPHLHDFAVALRGFFAADPAALSSLVLVEELLSGANPGTAAMYRFADGGSSLADALVRDADIVLHLRHEVRAIRQANGRVHVGLVGPDHRRAWLEADYAVVTAPVPIVLGWELSPPLPADQRRAFTMLSYGPATKVLMQFRSRWWRRTGRPNAFGTNLPIGAVWEAAEEQRDAAILTLLAGGTASAELQAIAKTEGSAGLVNRLRWLGRTREREPVAHVTSWDADRWALGGYAVFGPQFDPAMRPWLSRSFKHVLFAGEHTSEEWPGYMNGAVESGLRAAKELEGLEMLARLQARRA